MDHHKIHRYLQSNNQERKSIEFFCLPEDDIEEEEIEEDDERT
jgi:hypothetical protein